MLFITIKMNLGGYIQKSKPGLFFCFAAHTDRVKKLNKGVELMRKLSHTLSAYDVVEKIVIADKGTERMERFTRFPAVLIGPDIQKMIIREKKNMMFFHRGYSFHLIIHGKSCENGNVWNGNRTFIADVQSKQYHAEQYPIILFRRSFKASPVQGILHQKYLR